jgi:transcriptional regulator with XRE-family HTH domain
MTLLRRVLGEALRGQRLRQRRTLREVSGAARVSLGYLSEVERGQKEASSELLASICDALDVRLSELLREVSDTMRRAERAGELARVPGRALVPAGVGGGSRPVPPARRSDDETTFDDTFRVDRDVFESDRVAPAEPAAVPSRGPAVDRVSVELAPDDLPPVELSPADLPPADMAPVDMVTVPAPAQPEAATEVAELVPVRFGPLGRDCELDGLELAELEPGDELGEVDVLLGLTKLLCHPDGTLRGELAGAGFTA